MATPPPSAVAVAEQRKRFLDALEEQQRQQQAPPAAPPAAKPRTTLGRPTGSPCTGDQPAPSSTSSSATKATAAVTTTQPMAQPIPAPASEPSRPERTAAPLPEPPAEPAAPSPTSPATAEASPAAATEASSAAPPPVKTTAEPTAMPAATTPVPQATGPAKAPPPASAGASSVRRLRKELADLQRDPPPGCSAQPDDADFFQWRATIGGPPDTPYEGGLFHLLLRFPTDYPFKPPKVVFLTKVYNQHVDHAGNICLDILKESWSPTLNVSRLLLSITSLLTDPNPDFALDQDIARQYKLDRPTYNRTVREWVTKYALPNAAPPA